MNQIQTNSSKIESKPIKKDIKIGRNERVTIKKGAVKKELKWKVAEQMVKNEGWEIV